MSVKMHFSPSILVIIAGKNVSVVCSPKSGASLWDISGFNEQFEAARQRALPVLRPLAQELANGRPLDN